MGLMRREIGRIPPLLQHTLVLRELIELPMPEVAEELGSYWQRRSRGYCGRGTSSIAAAWVRQAWRRELLV